MPFGQGRQGGTSSSKKTEGPEVTLRALMIAGVLWINQLRGDQLLSQYLATTGALPLPTPNRLNR